jgi:hypothetical protein
LILKGVAVAMTTSVDNDEQIYSNNREKEVGFKSSDRFRKKTCRYWLGIVHLTQGAECKYS